MVISSVNKFKKITGLPLYSILLIIVQIICSLNSWLMLYNQRNLLWVFLGIFLIFTCNVLLFGYEVCTRYLGISDGKLYCHKIIRNLFSMILSLTSLLGLFRIFMLLSLNYSNYSLFPILIAFFFFMGSSKDLFCLSRNKHPNLN